MEGKQGELLNILYKLSSSDKVLNNEEQIEIYTNKLKEIYSNGFRHRYSDIYVALNTIRKQNPHRLPILSNNIYMLYEDCIFREKNNKDFIKSVSKLHDHVNLDIARLDEFQELARELQQNKTQVEEILPKLEDSKEDLRQVKNEYVGILGIFASIVITFTTTISFSRSILENMHEVSIYRLMLSIFSLGWISTVIIYTLLKFVYQTLVSGNRKTNIDGTESENIQKVYLVDISKINKIYIAFIIIIFFLWLIDFVSIRNSIKSKIIKRL